MKRETIIALAATALLVVGVMLLTQLLSGCTGDRMNPKSAAEIIFAPSAAAVSRIA